MASMDAAPVTKISRDEAHIAIGIGEAREDIKQTLTDFQKNVSGQLEKLIRETDAVLDLDKTQSKDDKLKEIKEKVDKIKEDVKSNLKPLTSLQTTSGSLKNKGKTTVEQSRQDSEAQKKWQDLDTKLEDILENAAMKHKHSEYQSLDANLQNCLKCLCIFPQDANIKKRTLIYWWIGEGIAHATADQTAEEIGEDYFQQLLDGSWIDPVNNKGSNIVRECTMDPWVRWLVIYLAREEYFFDLDKTGMPSSSPVKSRRACLLKNDSLPHLEPKSSFSREPKNSNKDGSNRGNPKISLLSVFNVDAEHLRAEYLGQKLKEMQSLLVLQLGRWQILPVHHIEFVDEDSEYFHKLGLPKRLRYLSFSGISRITELPVSVKNLIHLKVLDLRSCQNLEKLGEEIRFLKSLTHLDVSECYMLDQMPKGLGSLSQLEVLKGFMFGSLRSRDPCQLSELTKLKKLKKLSISIGSEAQMPANEMTTLKDITGLRSLGITWGKLSLTLSDDERETLEKNWTELRYPSDLEKLDLRCFPNSDVHLEPESLKKLKKLYIRGGQVVRLNVHSEGEKMKMNIEMVRLKFLKKLEEWPLIEEYFPSINYLEIHDCPNLRCCPPFVKEGVWIKEPISDEESLPAPASESVPGSTITPAPVATIDDPSHPPAISTSLPLSESPTIPPPTSVTSRTSSQAPAAATDVPSQPPAISTSLPPSTSIASPTSSQAPAAATDDPSQPPAISISLPLSGSSTIPPPTRATSPTSSQAPAAATDVPSQPPAISTSLPPPTSIASPTSSQAPAAATDDPSQPPAISNSLPLSGSPTIPPPTRATSPTSSQAPAAATDVPSQPPAISNSLPPPTSIASPTSSQAPAAATDDPSQPPAISTSLPLSGSPAIPPHTGFPSPTSTPGPEATTTDVASQPPAITRSLPLSEAPTVPPSTSVVSPTSTPDHGPTTVSSSAFNAPTLTTSSTTTDVAPH